MISENKNDKTRLLGARQSPNLVKVTSVPFTTGELGVMAASGPSPILGIVHGHLKVNDHYLAKILYSPTPILSPSLSPESDIPHIFKDMPVTLDLQVPSLALLSSSLVLRIRVVGEEYCSPCYEKHFFAFIFY